MFYIDYLLSDEERAELLSREIDFCEMSLGTAAYHRHGIAFPEQEGPKVLDALGLYGDAENYRDLQTPQGDYGPNFVHWTLVPLPTQGNRLVWAKSELRGLNES